VSAASEPASAAEPPASGVHEATLESGTDTNPFPGPRPFGENDRSLFFGRDRELSDLVALLFAQRAVLLHAPSGAGKSSLVSAGLIPRARQRGFEFLPVARVRGTASSGDGLSGNRYVSNVIENWRAAGLNLADHAIDLPDVLGALSPIDEPGRVVVFDQIEELFVLHPDRWKDRGDLFSQVQRSLDRDPLLHFLFVLRDDYLAWLDPLTPLLRDRLSTRYHLGGLTAASALDAVVRPFAATGRVFAPGVAEEFVRAIREQPADLSAGRRYEGEHVEPVQLQIVCRTFFERLPSDVTEIDAEDVGRHADVQQALVGFYEQAIGAAIKGHAGVRERSVRLWFERQLITPASTRGIVFRGERATGGLANQVVDELERRRVVRSEPRGPALWYELTHDRLIDAVRESNRAWFARRSRSTTRRALAVGGLCILLAAVLSFVAWHGQHGGASATGAAAPKASRISAPGQTVDFRVRGRAGQLLSATMVPDDGFVGELELFNAQGLPIGLPSAAGSSQPLLTTPLPATGVYRVQARGRGSSTGSFNLTLAVQSVGTRAQLTGPDPVPGSITASDQVNVYTFAARAGTEVAATMVWSGDFDLHSVLIGPGGRSFREVEGVPGTVAAVLPLNGTYQLHTWSTGGTTGTYLLQLQMLNGARTQPGTVSGSLSDDRPIDIRTVGSGRGGVLTISYPPKRGLPDDVSLVAPNGDTLRADYGEGGFTSLITPETTYIVVATGDDFSSGHSYSLSLAIQEPLPLPGGNASGRLTRTGQIEVYRLDPEQGNVATILVRPQGNFDPGVTVVQPDGTPLIIRDDGGPGQDELFVVQLRQRGLHQIGIGSTSSSHATGGFRITVTQHNAVAPAP
jgi:hypothetical protein